MPRTLKVLDIDNISWLIAAVLGLRRAERHVEGRRGYMGITSSPGRHGDWQLAA